MKKIASSIVAASRMDVEQCIRDNIPWTRLPDDVKQMLGNSAKEYDKLILEYSIRNQLR